MVYNERDVRNGHVIECAKQMMTAARTAPKAKGVDIIEVMMITGEDIMTLSNTLHKIGEDMGRGGLMRDADKEFMSDLKTELVESKNMRKRLEAKLDRKNKSIRKANSCPHTVEGDGCPVLNQEEKNEQIYDCDTCEHHVKPQSND